MTTRRLFIPDHHDRLALKKGEEMLAAMVVRLAAMIAAIGADDRLALNAARRLMRIGESCARRMLVAMARQLPTPVLSPLAPRLLRRLKALAHRKQYDPADVRYCPPPVPCPSFQLAEPLATFNSLDPAPGQVRRAPITPLVRMEQHGILTVRIFSTAGQVESSPDPDAPRQALERRLVALKRVVVAPARQARRMARWLARQEARPYGRNNPLRPGLAPGQIRNLRRREMEHGLLDALQMVAQRAIWPPDTS